MSYGTEDYTSGFLYPGTGPLSGSAIAAPEPYVEDDKASRLSAIFEGVAGTIGSIGDAFARIRYNATPVPGGYATRPSIYPNDMGRYSSASMASVGVAPSKTGVTTLVILGGLALLYFILRGRR